MASYTITLDDKEMDRLVSSLHAMACIQDDIEEADELEKLAIKLSMTPETAYRGIGGLRDKGKN